MKKILCTFILLSSFVAAVFASDSSSSSNTVTYSADTNAAQLVTSSVDYPVTAGDIYALVLQGTTYELIIDSSYKIRISSLGVLNVKGMTYRELKETIESMVNRSSPSTTVQFNLKKPSVFNVRITGEVTVTTEIETTALNQLKSVIEPYLTSYSSKRNIKVISADGKEKTYDLFRLDRFGDFEENPYLRPGDTILVSKYDRLVQISGAVKRPGTYELLPGEQLQTLITQYADGYTLYANKSDITLRRFTGGTGIYSVKYLTESDYVSDMTLVDDDRIAIGSIQDARPVFYIEGAVSSNLSGTESADAKWSAQNQGIVTSPSSISRLKMNYNDGESYASFIRSNRNMLTNSSDLSKAYVLRRSENGEDVESISIDITKIVYTTGYYDNLLIHPDDILVIPYIQYYVYVNGAVISAGKYAYQPDRDWTYYINLANGFNLDQNLFSAITIKDKNGKKLSKDAMIPPEATITAKRNSPNGGWLIPLLSSIASFITSVLTFVIFIRPGGNGLY